MGVYHMDGIEKHIPFVDAHRDDDDVDCAEAGLVGAHDHEGRPVMGHILARLIVAQTHEEGTAYRTFAHALARQLHAWSKGAVTVPDGEMLRLLRAAACMVLDEAQDE